MMRRGRLTLPLLILLTLIAGGLRFVSLDRPSVWGDEAATYGRVAGTYRELLDQLSDSSFPPLHYEMEWWVAQGLPYWGTVATPDDGPRVFMPKKFLVPGGIRLTPFALRFIPALAGMFFVPAIYFLARQLFGPRVALTAAFLACFSAYGLVYSRDAKMYMHFWLAVTLHVACGLLWLRTRRGLPWALWVLCGVAMVGLHASGFELLIVDALVVFTAPRQHWRKLVPLGGFVAWPAAVGPAYGLERLRRRFGWREVWRWDRLWVWPRLAARRFEWPVVVGFGVGVAVMLAAGFGPLGYYSAFSQKVQHVTAADRTQIDAGEIGLDWVDEYNRGRRLPDYLLYTTSAYLTGWEWPRHLPNIGADDQARVAPRTLRLLQIATVGLLTLLAVGLVPWRRAFAPARARLDRITQDGRAWHAARSRRTLWLAVWLTAVPWATYTQSTERPATILDGAAALLLKSPPDVAWPRAKLIADPALSAWPRLRQMTRDAAAQWPAAWRQYAAAWTPANRSTPAIVLVGMIALGLLGFVLWKRRAVGRGAIGLLGVAAVLLVVGSVVGVLPRKVNDDVWMPRYLGTVLPAAWVVAAVLIDRQPVRLRWATLGLFVVVNMAQFSGRVWGGSEPPTGLTAADVVAAQPQAVIASHPAKPSFRAYVDFGRFFQPEPGGGTLFTPAGRYYLRVLSGVPGELRQVRFGAYEFNLRMWHFTFPSLIERDLKASPEVDRFVVWSALPAGEIDQTDDLAARLGGQFKRVAEEIWPVRDHWRWIERYQVRRRTYQRIAPPVPLPVVTPTTTKQ